MAYFAKVLNGTVEKVIVAEASFFDTFVDDSPGDWIQTYKDRSKKKHYAAVGYSYDVTRDAFIPPKPYASWILVEDTCQWEAPVAYPDDDKMYDWDEETTSWIEVTGAI